MATEYFRTSTCASSLLFADSSDSTLRLLTMTDVPPRSLSKTTCLPYARLLIETRHLPHARLARYLCLTRSPQSLAHCYHTLTCHDTPLTPRSFILTSRLSTYLVITVFTRPDYLTVSTGVFALLYVYSFIAGRGSTKDISIVTLYQI
ncbi:hypothetical protein QCA50_008610 [Cerrena zonata]|uniref:Uncharacterized protein n=1 Tax=Cerrena zonata TaxID=2478898 RepID=A0AAW0GGV9_9APHY